MSCSQGKSLCTGQGWRDNALVVGFTANVNLNPKMVMVGIILNCFSHHIVKGNPWFVINLPGKDFQKEYDHLGFRSGWDGDKFAALVLKWDAHTKHLNFAGITGWQLYQWYGTSIIKLPTHYRRYLMKKSITFIESN